MKGQGESLIDDKPEILTKWLDFSKISTIPAPAPILLTPVLHDRLVVSNVRERPAWNPLQTNDGPGRFTSQCHIGHGDVLLFRTSTSGGGDGF